MLPCYISVPATLALIGLAVGAGCGQKTPKVNSVGEPLPAPEAQLTEGTNNNSGIVASNDALFNSSDLDAAFRTADGFIKTERYEDAARLLLGWQGKRLTDGEQKGLRDRLAKLRSAVADGIARGDATAQAAAEMLRSSSTHPGSGMSTE